MKSIRKKKLSHLKFIRKRQIYIAHFDFFFLYVFSILYLLEYEFYDTLCFTRHLFNCKINTIIKCMIFNNL